MKSRTLIILIALVVAAALLTVVLERDPAPASSDLTGQRLLPGLAEALNDVTSIGVRAGGDDGEVTLERGDAGWVVAQRGGYPADAGLIRRLLIRLGEARVLEPKTSNPEFYSRLGVGDVGADGGGVEVTLEGLPEPMAVIVGDRETRGGAGTYVRLGGGAQSYLVDAELAPAGTAVGWLDRELFDLDPEDVVSIDVRQDDGAGLRIERQAGELVVLDLPEGRSLESPTAPRSMAGVLRALNFDDVQPAADFADEPPAAVTEYGLGDGRRITARLWQRDDGRYAAFRLAWAEPAAGATPPADTDGETATAASPAAAAAARDERLAPWVFRLPAHKYDLMARRLEDLLAAPTLEPAGE